MANTGVTLGEVAALLRHEPTCSMRGYMAVPTDGCECRAPAAAALVAEIERVLREWDAAHGNWFVWSVMDTGEEGDDRLKNAYDAAMKADNALCNALQPILHTPEGEEAKDHAE